MARVKSVRSAGETEVFDIEVPDNHNFVANGMVVHNCHRVPADTFQEAVVMFPALWRLGLSAEPRRPDGKELLLFAHIGPIRARTEDKFMVPKVLRFRSDWKCPRVLRTDKDDPSKKVAVKLPHEPGRTTHIEKILAADPGRNELLASLIMSAHEKGRKLVVFSTLHEHLRALHRAAVKQGVPAKEFGYYLGASTKAEKAERERAKGKPILLTTYAMMGEGTDLPWLDCGLQAMPRANVVQPVGRIRRQYPDKGTPVWMDIVDPDSPVFVGYAVSRREWYKSIGAEVKDMD